MWITEKQLLVLIDTMAGSLKICDNGFIFGYDEETRKNIYNQIINQQTEVIKAKKK